MKKLFYVVLAILLTLCVTGCGQTVEPTVPEPTTQEEEQVDVLEVFYNAVDASYQALMVIDSDIYENWRAAIYDDQFNNDINEAIAAAQEQYAEEIDALIELDGAIVELYKDARETEQAELVKSVMMAYSDYYDFVINVSGSFNDYSEGQLEKQKAVSSALRELLYEL